MSDHFDQAPRASGSHRAAARLRRGGLWRSGAVVIASMVSALTAGLLLAVTPAQAAQAGQARETARAHGAAQADQTPRAGWAAKAGAGWHSPFAPARAYTGPNGEVELNAACTAPNQPGQAACFAISRQTKTKLRSGAAESAAAAAIRPAGYGPSALRRAYHLPSSRGAGHVVAVVDAYNDPKAESDLAHYRRAFHLPPCTRANGCFRKVDQNGGTRYPHANAGWAAEISLDLDMVSAVCPKCHILLVEASSSYINDLGKAVNTAVRLGAKYISNSYGTAESSSDSRRAPHAAGRRRRGTAPGPAARPLTPSRLGRRARPVAGALATTSPRLPTRTPASLCTSASRQAVGQSTVAPQPRRRSSPPPTPSRGLRGPAPTRRPTLTATARRCTT